MTEQAGKISEQEILRARELLDNPQIGWHALNGFDFGAAIGILEQGIHPYAQFGGRQAVSLSASPSDPTLKNHPSFEYYVPQSISFPVPLRGSKIIADDSHDEYQYEDAIPLQELRGIMIPEAFSDMRLAELPILKPPTRSRIGAYVTRQLRAIDRLAPGATSAESGRSINEQKNEYSSVYDNYDKRKIAAATLNQIVLTQYENTFAALLKISQPTLHQAIAYLGNRYGIDTLVMPPAIKP